MKDSKIQNQLWRKRKLLISNRERFNAIKMEKLTKEKGIKSGRDWKGMLSKRRRNDDIINNNHVMKTLKWVISQMKRMRILINEI